MKSNLKILHILPFVLLLMTTSCQLNSQSTNNLVPHNLSIFYSKNVKAVTQIKSDIKQSLHLMEIISKEKRELLPLYHYAKEIRDKGTPLIDLITNLSRALKHKTGTMYTTKEAQKQWKIQGFEKFEYTENRDLNGMPVDHGNTVIAKAVLLDTEDATVLKKKLTLFRENLLEVIEKMPSSIRSMNITGVSHINSADLRKIKASLEVNEPVNKNWKSMGLSSWESYFFKDASVAASLLTLSQLELETILIVNQLVDLIANNFGNKTLVFDKLDIAVSAPLSKVKLGQEYTAELALAAFSTMSEFNIEVNEKDLPVKDGKGYYTIKTNKLGKQSYKVRIKIVNPLTGEHAMLTKEFYYEVIP